MRTSTVASPRSASSRRGRTLVDLHGQWEQQSLLAPAEQRHLLDAFAGAAAEKPAAALRSALGDVAAIDARLASLGGDTRSRAREIDLLRFQITEIDDAAVTADEEAQLEATITLLGDADELRQVLADAHAALEGAAADATGQAVAALDTFPGPLADLVERGRAAQAELSELVHDLRLRHDSIQADPEQLAEAVGRRQHLRELRRKYGETLADVLAYVEESPSAPRRAGRHTISSLASWSSNASTCLLRPTAPRASCRTARVCGGTAPGRRGHRASARARTRCHDVRHRSR